MHKLNRPSQSPNCLSQYRHGQHRWVDVTQAEKSEIWLKIDDMQNKRCAYCEISINTSAGNRNAHIEHFRQKRADCYPQGTFEWDNLFGSCNREDSCGKYKDKQLPYDHTVLIKMDIEDPEEFFEFLPDGNVKPKSGLDSTNTHRAEETIRIFNLNGSLRQIRETALKGYLQTAEELAGFANEFDEEDWRPLLQEELDRIKDLPFATAIKHTLLPA